MKRLWIGVVALGMAGALAGQSCAQNLMPANLAQMDGKQLIETVVQHEAEASKSRGFYTYLSVEKSERTGGHEWTERVAETSWGKVRFLIAEDGKPLSPQREAAEKARLQDEADHPDAFKAQEAAKGEDEQHAREMMALLPKAFLFDQPVVEGEYVRVKYRPNPAYSPGTLEERVLHAMTGSVLVDPRMIRTRELDGHMPQDVSIGFGFLATIHAGSNFSTTREHVDGTDWKTEALHTDINGKALFLKTIARQQEARRSEYKRIPNGMTVAEAVKLVESE